MKNTKIKIPATRVESRYTAVKSNLLAYDTTTATTTTSQGDPTNMCTTILTTTHFI
jgi:hypothetical protein